MADVYGTNDGNNYVSTTYKDPGTNRYTTNSDDWVWSFGGNDIARGGTGNDRMWGGNGWDILWGEDGTDLIWGEEGNDSLYGGAGNDTLWGGLGNDAMWGNTGQDVLSGNSGADTFYFARGDSGTGAAADVIKDFFYTQNDKINLWYAGIEEFAGYTQYPGTKQVGYFREGDDTIVRFHGGGEWSIVMYNDIVLEDFGVGMIASDFVLYDPDLLV